MIIYYVIILWYALVANSCGAQNPVSYFGICTTKLYLSTTPCTLWYCTLVFNYRLYRMFTSGFYTRLGYISREIEFISDYVWDADQGISYKNVTMAAYTNCELICSALPKYSAPLNFSILFHVTSEVSKQWPPGQRQPAHCLITVRP